MWGKKKKATKEIRQMYTSTKKLHKALDKEVKRVSNYFSRKSLGDGMHTDRKWRNPDEGEIMKLVNPTRKKKKKKKY